MDMTAIRNALATQITQYTGLRCDGQARDHVNPPCAVVVPGTPFITYGQTMDETTGFVLVVLLIISDSAQVEITQRALDAYLGIGPGETESVPAAVLKDPTLMGTAEWCEPMTISNYGRIEYAGVTYFGARLNLQGGAH